MKARPSFLTRALLNLSLIFSLSASAAEEIKEPLPLPLDELRIFTEVFERIKNAYVEPVDDATLLENAIKGMLSGLDPHSAYLDAEAFKHLRVNTSGEFGGLGIEVGMQDGFVRVIAPIDDTPAHKAGVLAGDLIIKLDDQAVQGMDLSDAVKLMRGKPGIGIRLTILREGENQPIELTVIRAVIKVTSIKSRLLDNHYAYLRVTQFQVQSGKDLVGAIRQLAAEHELKGAILDLRNNPGGVLQAAVDVSDAFLDEGLIVYTEGRVNQAAMRFNATPETAMGDLPLVVLINGGSASASEIVAGALQDRRRAVIMGMPSFGKGSVQTVLPLTNQSALKLTTARYYTPSGRSIQAEGIVPDIQVGEAKVTQVKSRHGLKEANLQGHLSGGQLDKPEVPVEDNGEEQALLEKDYPLNEALNLLKGLSILNADNDGS